MTGALIIGIGGAAAFGLIAAAAVPTQIPTVEGTWRDSYGWQGDVADDVGSQQTESYALADKVTPTWLFSSASLLTSYAQDDRDFSYNDYALPSDRYDYAASIDEPTAVTSASYSAGPLELEDAAATTARSAEQVTREVREVEATTALEAQPVEPEASSEAIELPVEVLSMRQP